MGFAIGPLIGGGLASVVGLSWPFVGCSAALVASSAAAASLLPETMHGAHLRQQQMQMQQQFRQPQSSPPSEQSQQQSRHREESQSEHSKPELSPAAPTPQPSTFQLAAQLAQRPALQGLGPVVFMNGFGQGAMPVRKEGVWVCLCGCVANHRTMRCNLTQSCMRILVQQRRNRNCVHCVNALCAANVSVSLIFSSTFLALLFALTSSIVQHNH